MSMTLTVRRITLPQRKWRLDIRKAIQSSGDYLGKVWAVIFNMLGVDFYKLPPDEQKILKKILSKVAEH